MRQNFIGDQSHDTKHSTIMELACALAEKHLVDTYHILPEDLSDENGEYLGIYQDEFNGQYDHYMTLLENL